MLKEFREFAMRGNVMDLAIAVIIGGAFGKIITSLVNDVLMPLIGLALGGVNFSELAIVVGDAVVKWGAFVQSIIDFLLVAFVIFMLVRTLNRFKKPEGRRPNNERMSVLFHCNADPGHTLPELYITALKTIAGTCSTLLGRGE